MKDDQNMNNIAEIQWYRVHDSRVAELPFLKVKSAPYLISEFHFKQGDYDILLIVAGK